MIDKDFEINSDAYGKHLDRQWKKLLSDLEWSDLRDKFFLECVGSINGKIVVDLSPHNCFEWFRSNVERMERPA